ncbi:hypothetical protein DWY92_12545 [Bacteroides uniformis]|uniref:Uncharacterized protein n=1 Tax=Bacteroides uniformis TaxID=820 RepID=A0A412BA53_BACUN|nr:hypothetical protein DXD58_01745 [Bacteroides sp. D20]RGQ50283.1 hypothetical protein DWY92_12545 [Bacteroides uniformis]RHC01638.1 hypothetical protein DW861_15115 [Bacteroides uniformis]
MKGQEPATSQSMNIPPRQCYNGIMQAKLRWQAPSSPPFHFGKRPPKMKSRKKEPPDECNYETVKKETRNESL